MQYIMDPTCIDFPTVKVSTDACSYRKFIAMCESDQFINDYSFLSSSMPTHSEKLPVVGSPFWMAPEVLRDEPYNEKVGTCK